jgi:uncharacterized membrane protein YphA (DoxX/SURF4 family)
MDRRLETVWMTSRIALGLMAFLAGLDKFLNLLTNWEQYVSPLATRVLPFSATTFMHIVGIIEMVVGLAILTKLTRVGAYVAAIWLLCIALNLVTTGKYFDIAVRDIELAIAAFVLAKLTEVHESALATVGQRRRDLSGDVSPSRA